MLVNPGPIRLGPAAWTVTPGSTLPCWSRTTPRIAPVDTCAAATPAPKRTAAADTAMTAAMDRQRAGLMTVMLGSEHYRWARTCNPSLERQVNPSIRTAAGPDQASRPQPSTSEPGLV